MAKVKSRETAIKKMAEALFKGAKLLSETCPKCGSPLMEVDGRKVCYVCMEEEKSRKVEKPSLENIEKSILQFMSDLSSMLRSVRDVREAMEILRCILVASSTLRAIKALKELEKSK